jgi:hypothetical protein
MCSAIDGCKEKNVIKKAMLCLSLLILVLAVGCEADSGGNSGVTVSIDASNIHNAIYMQELLVIPVTAIPKSVPAGDIAYRIELLSREGYSYGTESVGWAKGETPTAREVIFFLSSDDASASHVYLQLRADLRSGNMVTLKADASALLKVKVSKY